MESAVNLYIAITLSTVSWLMFLTYLPSNNHIPGVKLWVSGLLTFIITLVLFSQASEKSVFWSEYVPNLLLLASLTLITIGIRSFFGIQRKGWLIASYMLVSAPLVSYYFTYSAPDETMSRMLLTILALSCFVIIIFSLIGVKYRAGTSKSILLCFCVISSVMLFVRIYLKLNYSTELRIEQYGMLEQAIHLLSLSFGVAFSLIFAMLCQERNNKYLATLTMKSNNDQQLKSLYMATLKAELTTPITKISKISDTLTQSDVEDTTKNALFIQKQTQIIADIAQQTLKPDPSTELCSDSVNDVAYTKIEAWLNGIITTMNPLADDKQIALSVTFNDPVAPSYLLDQYKLRLLLIGIIGKLIEVKIEGEINLAIFIKSATNARDAATLTFNISDIGRSQTPLISQQDFHNGFTSRLCEKTLELLNSSFKFEGDNYNYHHILFSIKASEGTDNDVRYQIPRFATPNFSSLEAILISDCQHTADTVNSALKEKKHHLTIINNTEEVLSQLNAQKYDVIIIDINAVAFNSLELPNLIKNKCHSNKHIPMIALTNNLCAAAKLDLEVEGLTTFVAKPIKHSSLIRAIGSVIEASLLNDKHSSPSEKSLIDREQVENINHAPKHDISANSDDNQPDNQPRPTPKVAVQSIATKPENTTQPPETETEMSPEPVLFTPKVIPLLKRNSQGREIKSLIQHNNKNINNLLADIKKQIGDRDKNQLKTTLYKLALSSDKLGYAYLAEKLLTIDVDNINGDGHSQYLKIESLLVKSQTSLAEHLKTIDIDVKPTQDS